MLNQLILKFQQMPKLMMGFLMIIASIVGLYYYDPPKTICDLQMEAVMAQLKRGFFSNKTTGSFGQGIDAALKFCMKTNSSGGCNDMFNRLNYFEKQVKSVPTECGGDPATAVVHDALRRGIRLIAEIAWGDKPPESKFNRTSWLENNDIALFCRLKTQYQRLYGEDKWQGVAWSTIANLPGVDTLTKRELWDRSLFSYPCSGL